MGDRELFVAFHQFPWFRDARVGQLLNVELLRTHHLRWPELDVDLEVDSIEHPAQYPLVSRIRTGVVQERRTARSAGPGGRIRKLRRAELNPVEAMAFLIGKMGDTRTNKKFLGSMNQ